MQLIVFFLEEQSAREMLEGLLPRILPPNVDVKYIVFEGKQDLEKRIAGKLRAWCKPTPRFVVIRDQDRGDCVLIKDNLTKKCSEVGQSKTLIRIACRELESFYLGDLLAVSKAMGVKNIIKRQEEKKFRNPDALPNPSRVLKELVPSYQKISGSRSIAAYMDINNNRSPSFNALVKGIHRLIETA